MINMYYLNCSYINKKKFILFCVVFECFNGEYNIKYEGIIRVE